MNTVGTLIKKVKGQTSASQKFAFGQQLSFVGSMAQGWRGFWLHFSGRLVCANDSLTDPVKVVDLLLKMLGTIEVTLVNDGGDYNIVPSGTSFRTLFHNIRRIMETQIQNSGRGNRIPQAAEVVNVYPTVQYYKSPSGLYASTPEDFLVSFYFPFQALGVNDTEQDIACLNPHDGDRQLNVIISPPAYNINDVSVNAIFADSNHAYSLQGIQNAVGENPQVIFEGDYMTALPKANGDRGGTSNIGSWLPVWQEKVMTQVYAASPINDFQLTNWDRGGSWAGMFFNEWGFDTTNGSENMTLTPNFSILRGAQLLADADPIHQFSLLGGIGKFNPYQTVRSTSQGIFNLEPVFLDMNSGRSFFSLPDFSQYITAQKQINLQFDTLNLPIIAQGDYVTEYVSVMTLRYIKRNR